MLIERQDPGSSLEGLTSQSEWALRVCVFSQEEGCSAVSNPGGHP